jgi:hypothetical protein
MAKIKLTTKTIRKLADAGLDGAKIITQQAPRPPKRMRKVLKAFGLKWW